MCYLHFNSTAKLFKIKNAACEIESKLWVEYIKNLWICECKSRIHTVNPPLRARNLELMIPPPTPAILKLIMLTNLAWDSDLANHSNHKTSRILKGRRCARSHRRGVVSTTVSGEYLCINNQTRTHVKVDSKPPKNKSKNFTTVYYLAIILIWLTIKKECRGLSFFSSLCSLSFSFPTVFPLKLLKILNALSAIHYVPPTL